MGGRNARAMAEAVGRGEVEAGIALHWHLAWNHYPPLPAALAETARAAIVAIVAAKEGQWDRGIPVPEGILFRGRRSITAAEAVEAMHLDAFIE